MIPNIEPILKSWNPRVEVLTVSSFGFLDELAKSSLISSVTHLSIIKMYVSCSFDLLEPFRTVLKRWASAGGSGLREIKIEVLSMGFRVAGSRFFHHRVFAGDTVEQLQGTPPRIASC